MPRLEFGKQTMCHACWGVGSRVQKMTPDEKEAHDRENRRRAARGETVDRMPVTKPCPDCDGKGYVVVHPSFDQDRTGKWP